MSTDDLKAKPGRRRTLLIAAVILIFACGACGLIYTFFGDTPTEPAAGEVAAVETVEPTAEPEQPEPTEGPTSTPEPTNTPEPTSTPEPTDTPEPTPSPTPPPEPIVLTGSGDSIVDFEKWPGPGLVHIVGNPGSQHFAVINYDAAGTYLDLLVNTTEPYDGVRPLDFFDGQQTTRFEVTATGDWQIEVLPLLENATLVEVPGSAAGTGDAVLVLSADADIATITGNADAKHFAVNSYGGLFADLLVNTTEPYTGQVQVGAGARVFVITAEGDWTIDLTAR